MEWKGAPQHPDARIAALARGQHGDVAIAQLLAAGLTRRQVETRLRSRRLHRVHQGVYVVGHAALTREGRWMAAVLACGDGTVLSHRAAAAHWGIRSRAAESIDVTLPRRTGRRSRRGIALHRLVFCRTTRAPFMTASRSRRLPARCSIWSRSFRRAASNGR
jgi:predicted transcriptional regulator of viral defense system